MKRKNPSIKGLISVGGWNFNDCAASASATYGQGSATCEIFSTIAASEERTRAFARNVIDFCRKWGFDGFDLDWEYPVVAGHNSNEKPFRPVQDDYENYITMLRVMKEEFVADNPSNPLLLTAAVGVGKSTVEDAYNIAAMNEHLDLINLMTYDLHGGWESRTGCNANLYATQEDIEFGGGVGAGEAVAGYPLSVSWAVDYWIERGASPSKLTLGLGTYGRGWKLADPAQTDTTLPRRAPPRREPARRRRAIWRTTRSLSCCSLAKRRASTTRIASARTSSRRPASGSATTTNSRSGPSWSSRRPAAWLAPWSGPWTWTTSGVRTATVPCTRSSTWPRARLPLHQTRPAQPP